MNDTDAELAMRVKGRIEKITLDNVVKYIEETYLPDQQFIMIKLDLDLIKLLKIEVDANSICNS